MVGYLPVVMTPMLVQPWTTKGNVGRALEAKAHEVVRDVLGFSHLIATTSNPALVRGMRRLGYHPTGEIVLEKHIGSGASFRLEETA